MDTTKIFRTNCFATFCASVGKVLEYKENRAKIDIGTDGHPLRITISETGHIWTCSGYTHGSDIPALSVEGSSYKNAHDNFVNEFNTKCAEYLAYLEAMVNNLPEKTEDTFAWISQLGTVVSYTRQEFEVLVYVSGDPHVFKNCASDPMRRGNYEFLGQTTVAASPVDAFTKLLGFAIERLKCLKCLKGWSLPCQKGKSNEHA